MLFFVYIHNPIGAAEISWGATLGTRITHIF